MAFAHQLQFEPPAHSRGICSGIMLTLSVLMAGLAVGSNTGHDTGACGVRFAFGGASKAGTLRHDSHTEARWA